MLIIRSEGLPMRVSNTRFARGSWDDGILDEEFFV